MSKTTPYKLKIDVNDYVKAKLTTLGLQKHTHFNEESAMSPYLKEALEGGGKNRNQKILEFCKMLMLSDGKRVI